MKRWKIIAAVAVAFLMGGVALAAAIATGNEFVTATVGKTVFGFVDMYLDGSNVAQPVSASKPMPVVEVAGGGTVTVNGATSNATDGQDATTTNVPSASYGYGWNAVTGKWDRVRLDTSDNMKVADPNNAAFSGAVPMTVGQVYASQRSIAANCTVAGNATLTFSDASTLTLPVAVGFQTFPFAVTEVNSETATCTFANLK